MDKSSPHHPRKEKAPDLGENRTEPDFPSLPKRHDKNLYRLLHIRFVFSNPCLSLFFGIRSEKSTGDDTLRQ